MSTTFSLQGSSIREIEEKRRSNHALSCTNPYLAGTSRRSTLTQSQEIDLSRNPRPSPIQTAVAPSLDASQHSYYYKSGARKSSCDHRRSTTESRPTISPGSSSKRLSAIIDTITTRKNDASQKSYEHQQHLLNEVSQYLEHTNLGVYEWTLEKATSLANVIFFSLIPHQNHTSDSETESRSYQTMVSGWKILYTAITEWWCSNDPLCYAVMVQDVSSVKALSGTCVLDALRMMACGTTFVDRHAQDINRSLICTGAAACLAGAWRCLERIQYGILYKHNVPVSGDRVWWIGGLNETREWTILAVLARSVLNQQSEDHLILSLEETQTSAVSLLTQLLQYGCDEWVHEMVVNERDDAAGPEKLADFLLEHAERLRDPSMPFSSYARLSMSSFHLLLVLTQKTSLQVSSIASSRIRSLSNELSLWENLWHHVTSTDGIFNSRQASTWAVQLLHQRLICGDDTFTTLPIQDNDNWSAAISKTWTRLLELGGHADGSVCARIKSFLFCIPDISRTGLEILFRDDQQHICQDDQRRNLEMEDTPRATIMNELVSCLIKGISNKDHDNDSSYQHALILYHLLSDASVHHDDLSKSLWNEMTCEKGLAIFDKLVFHSQDLDDSSKPMVLVLLDLLFLILSHAGTSGLQNALIQSAEKIEGIIGIMTPSDARMNMAAMDLDETTLSADSAESDKSTPTAHNLSRIGIDLSTVEIRTGTENKGIGSMVQLAAASFLVAVTRSSGAGWGGECTESDIQHSALVRRRVDDTTSYFSSEFFKPQSPETNEHVPPIESTLEWTMRRLRFLSLILQDDKFRFTAEMVHAINVEEKGTIAQLRKRCKDNEKKLEEYQGNERRLLAKHAKMESVLETKAAHFVRERSLIHRQSQLEIKQALSVEEAQRRRVEGELARTRAILEQKEKDVANAVKEAMENKAAYESASSSLQECSEKLSKSTSAGVELQNALERSQSEVQTLTEQLRSAMESVTTLTSKATSLQAQMEDKEEHLNSAEESYQEMQQSLECLFADMVSLAQLYEIKEKEASGSRKDSDSLIEKLKRELKSERERNDRLERRQKQVEYENDALSKKYEKVRDKLEEERASRRNAMEEEYRKRTQPISYMNHLNASRLSNKENSYSSSSHRSKTQSRKGRHG